MGTWGALSALGEAVAGSEELKRQRARQTQADQLQQKEFGLQEQGLGLREREFGETQRKNRETQFLRTYTSPDGRVHILIRDPATGFVRDQALGFEQTPMQEKFAAAEKILGRAMTDDEKRQLLGITPKDVHYSSHMPVKDPHSLTGWSWVVLDEKTQQQVKIPGAPDPRWSRSAATGASPTDPIIPKLAKKWADDNVPPPAKYRAATEAYMEDNDIHVKPKMTGQEARLRDLVKQVEPKLTQLIDIIEKNNLQEQNDWIFGDRSALMQHLRFFGYKRGVKPDQVSADLIKTAAALKVMGASPWIQLGRGKYMYETIAQHLPDPSDTPALLYDKVQFLKGVMEEARDSLPKETGMPQSDDSTVNDYLKSIGVNP